MPFCDSLILYAQNKIKHSVKCSTVIPTKHDYSKWIPLQGNNPHIPGLFIYWEVIFIGKHASKWKEKTTFEIYINF